jgi:hypothetical protein
MRRVRVRSGHIAAEMPHSASAERSKHAHRRSTPRRAIPRPRGGLGLPHLRGGKRAPRQTRVAEPHFDFDDSVAPDARAHGQRQTAEDELKMRHLQPLRRQGDLAIGGEASRLEMDADCELGVGGGDDENGSLNLKHENLFSMNVFGSPRPGMVQEGLIESVEEVRGQMCIATQR